MKKLACVGVAAIVLASVPARAEPLDSETLIPAKTGHIPIARARTLQPNRIAPAPPSPRDTTEKNRTDLNRAPLDNSLPATAPLTPTVPSYDTPAVNGGVPAAPPPAATPVLPSVPNPRTGPGQGFSPPTPNQP